MTSSIIRCCLFETEHNGHTEQFFKHLQLHSWHKIDLTLEGRENRTAEHLIFHCGYGTGRSTENLQLLSSNKINMQSIVLHWLGIY